MFICLNRRDLVFFNEQKSGDACGNNPAHGWLPHFNPLLTTIRSEKLRQLIIVCAKSIHPFVEIQYEALVFLEGVSGAAASINQRSTYETSVSLPKQSRRRRRPSCSLIWMQGWRQLAVLAVLAILAILAAAMQPRSWSIRELPAEA